MVFVTGFKRAVLGNLWTIINLLKEIKHDMASNESADQLSFSDVQSSVNQLVNDNTQQNNAVAAQIKEVQRLILDFSNKIGQGGTPSQAELQGVIAQLASVHSLVQQNTAAIQQVGAQIAEADPAPAGTGDGTDTGTGSGTGDGTGTDNPPTDGTEGGQNMTFAGQAKVGQNPSSGTGKLGGKFS